MLHKIYYTWLFLLALNLCGSGLWFMIAEDFRHNSKVPAALVQCSAILLGANFVFGVVLFTLQAIWG